MLALRNFMDRPEGWGRDQGRHVYQRLLRFVEESAGTIVFKVSMKGVQRLDISFASETVVELARRYRRFKGFCLIDLSDADLIENLDAAAKKKDATDRRLEREIRGSDRCRAERRNTRSFPVRDDADTGARHRVRRPQGTVDRQREHEVQTAMGAGFFVKARKRCGQRGVEFVYQRIE